MEYAIIYDWCRGHIPDDEIVLHLLSGHLTCMAGATRGVTRARTEEKLAELRSTGVPELPSQIAAKAAAPAKAAKAKPARPAKAAKPAKTAKPRARATARRDA